MKILDENFFDSYIKQFQIDFIIALNEVENFN